MLNLNPATATTKSQMNQITPWKINMEHNHRGWEDHVPLEMGDLNVPC